MLGRSPNNSSAGGFLPEDYVHSRAEKRASVLTLVMFGVVMFGVASAFFVTNRQWIDVRTEQQDINSQYTREAQKIEQLKALERQKAEMLAKAELTTALIERIPRSLLTAELVTRMPEAITLLNLELTSKRIMAAAAAAPPPPATRPTTGSLMRSGGGAAGAAEPQAVRVAAPRYEYTLKVTGVSQQNNDIADYLASLKQSPLLEGVDLTYIKPMRISDIDLRRFELVARLRHDADARSVEPVVELRKGEKTFQETAEIEENAGPVEVEPPAQKVTDVPESAGGQP